jgi:hypothetical protein
MPRDEKAEAHDTYKKIVFGDPNRPPDEVGDEEEINKRKLYSGLFRANSIAPEEYNQPSAPVKSEAEEYYDEMMRLSEEGPASRDYREYLDRYPKPEEHTPSKWTRIAAALTAAGVGYSNPQAGYTMSRDMLNRKYRDAVEQYRMQGLGKEKAAEMETTRTGLRTRNLNLAREYGLKYQDYLTKQQQYDRTQTERENAGRRTETYQSGQLGLGQRRNEIADATRQQTGRYQQGQLNIGQANANTAASNAKTNQDRLAETRTQNEATRKNREATLGLNRGKSMQDAIDVALLRMKSDPLYGAYVTVNDKGIPDVAPDDKSEAYRVFKAELDRMTQSILRSGQYQDQEEEEPYDWLADVSDPETTSVGPWRVTRGAAPKKGGF